MAQSHGIPSIICPFLYAFLRTLVEFVAVVSNHVEEPHEGTTLSINRGWPISKGLEGEKEDGARKRNSPLYTCLSDVRHPVNPICRLVCLSDTSLPDIWII